MLNGIVHDFVHFYNSLDEFGQFVFLGISTFIMFIIYVFFVFGCMNLIA